MYKIRLPNFEGPFDLLLYFLRRDELNIYDIPISRITTEFLNYIRVIKFFDLELAGEFILMASTLMYIKTQMLLPRQLTEDGLLPEDPRSELVQRILEYKQFKEAANDISAMYSEQRYTYYKELFDVEYTQAEGGMIYKNANLFDLMKAFKAALDRNASGKIEHVVEMFPVTIEDKTKLILEELKTKFRLSFFEVVRGLNRTHVVVTFLALLEMMKNEKIFISQDENFEDIVIARRPVMN